MSAVDLQKKFSAKIFKLLGMKNFDEREKFGIFVAFVGILANFALAATKFAVGFFTGAISIIADALNNFSDMGTSAAMLAGFYIAARPADNEHPFGHGRAEYIAGLFISLAMIFFAAELLYTSAEKIVNPENFSADTLTLIILCLTVAAKFALAYFYRRAGKRINSQAISAAAADSFSDCLATSVVIISVAVYVKFGINIDGAAGLAVSLFIIYGGWENLKKTLDSLLGEPPSAELIKGIKKIVEDSPKVIGVHDLIIHNYGSQRNFASMHVEIPATTDLLTAHEIIDKLEKKIYSEFDTFITLHVDPVVTDSKEFDELFSLANEILHSVESSLSLHDFRVVPYKDGHKIIFEVVIPQNFYLSDKDFRKEFQRRLMTFNPKYRAIIHLDHQYC